MSPAAGTDPRHQRPALTTPPAADTDLRHQRPAPTHMHACVPDQQPHRLIRHVLDERAALLLGDDLLDVLEGEAACANRHDHRHLLLLLEFGVLVELRKVWARTTEKTDIARGKAQVVSEKRRTVSKEAVLVDRNNHGHVLCLLEFGTFDKLFEVLSSKPKNTSKSEKNVPGQIF